MNDMQHKRLNRFFVRIFNQILAWEEQTLRNTGAPDLSVRELHVIEAVSNLAQSGQNTMANVAKFLSVSPGSVTTAVNVLVKKGYLERSYTPKDRRIIFISLTAEGERVNEIHEKFHEEMVTKTVESMEPKNLDALLDAVDGIGAFFEAQAPEREYK